MRSLCLAVTAVIITACAAPDAEPEAAPPEAGPPPAAAPSAPTLADFAGTWENRATLEGTAEPVPSTMTGTAAGTDWRMSLSGRPEIPLEVSLVGDSLITRSAEYESVLRPGVMVTVRTANVLSDSVLVGNLVAYYRTPAGVDTVNGTIRGTRMR